MPRHILAHTGVETKRLTRSVANSNAMLVGILNFDIVVPNSIVAVDRAPSFCQCLKQGAIPLLQSTQSKSVIPATSSVIVPEVDSGLHLSQLPKDSMSFSSRNELLDDILAQDGV